MAEGAGARVCLGAIAGAHGVRGLVKIKSFTEDPANLTAYGPLGDEAGGRRFEIAVTGEAKGLLLARIAGVADREAAQALRGVRLYVDRAALPEPEEAAPDAPVPESPAEEAPAEAAPAAEAPAAEAAPEAAAEEAAPAEGEDAAKKG